MEVNKAKQATAAGAVVPMIMRSSASLSEAPLEQLLAETYVRLQALPKPQSRVVTRKLADLVELGAGWLETPENRFSLVYVRQLVENYYGYRRQRPDLRGATFLELGCGAENPVAVSIVMLMLGAERAFGVDDSPMFDLPRAVRGVSRLVRAMLMDPKSLVADSSVTPTEVLTRLRGFDLAKLERGDASGIDRSRLDYHQESIDALSLPDASCALCCSSAVLEHVADIKRTARELARVTKPGGFGVHDIDYNDHGIYGGEAASPITFLTEQPDAIHVRTCNRVRHGELLQAFGDAGFEVLENAIYERVEPLESDLRALLPRFRHLSREDLSVTRAVINLRRRP